MTIAEICQLLGVNKSSVHRYFRQGMPHTRHEGGTYTIDVAECRRWIEDSFSQRPRAKKAEPDELNMRDVAERADPDEIIALGTEEDITPSDARKLKDLMTAANAAEVLNIRRKRVVPIEDAKRAVTSVLAATRAGLMQLPGRTARIITAKLGLPTTQEAVVREAMDTEIERLCRELAENPLDNLGEAKDIKRKL